MFLFELLLNKDEGYVLVLLLLFCL